MREAASRGFWMTSYAPYGYRRVYVQDGAKKRPKLEPVEGEAGLAQAMFRLPADFKFDRGKTAYLCASFNRGVEFTDTLRRGGRCGRCHRR